MKISIYAFSGLFLFAGIVFLGLIVYNMGYIEGKRNGVKIFYPNCYATPKFTEQDSVPAKPADGIKGGEIAQAIFGNFLRGSAEG